MAGITFSVTNVLGTQPAGTFLVSKVDTNFNDMVTALSGLVAALTDLPLARNYTGFQAWADAGNLVAAATLNLGDANNATVTGNTGITAISNKQAGASITLTFTGTPILTHSATLILQGAVNAQIAAGDVYVFKSDTPGTWREVSRRITTNADSTHFLAGDGVMRIPVSSGGFTAQAQPVRALSTTYQNLGATAMLVTVQVSSDGTHGNNVYTAVCLTDAATPPTTQVAGGTPSDETTVTASGSFTFLVLPNNYYRVNGSAHAVLTKWTEWT